MLTETFMYDTSLPRLPYRHTLVSVGRLKPRASALQDEFEAVRKKLEEKKAKMEEEQRRKREENLELEKMEAAEGGGQSKEELAIQEANALRAKLGLKPLRM